MATCIGCVARVKRYRVRLMCGFLQCGLIPVIPNWLPIKGLVVSKKCRYTREFQTEGHCLCDRNGQIRFLSNIKVLDVV